MVFAGEFGRNASGLDRRVRIRKRDSIGEKLIKQYPREYISGNDRADILFPTSERKERVIGSICGSSDRLGVFRRPAEFFQNIKISQSSVTWYLLKEQH